MKRFVEGTDRGQSTLFPEYLDCVDENNPARVIDVFVDELELAAARHQGRLPPSNWSVYSAIFRAFGRKGRTLFNWAKPEAAFGYKNCLRMTWPAV